MRPPRSAFPVSLMNGASVTSSVCPTLSIVRSSDRSVRGATAPTRSSLSNGCDDVLEEIRSAKGIVVQQHDHVSATGRDPVVCAAA